MEGSRLERFSLQYVSLLRKVVLKHELDEVTVVLWRLEFLNLASVEGYGGAFLGEGNVAFVVSLRAH